MNWNSRTVSEVNKEKIWKELVASEQRDIKIFDRYRPSTSAIRKGIATTAPVSEREDRFLNRTRDLYQTLCQKILPELQSHSRSLPFYNIEERVSDHDSSCRLSGTFAGSALQVARSPSASSPMSPLVVVPGEGTLSTTTVLTQSSSGSREGSSPQSPNARHPSIVRPTTGSDYGSRLEPLVAHKMNPFRYSVPRSKDLRASVFN